MAETTSLLNCRTGLPYRGFESPSFRTWRFHLMVRIHASHAWYTGSIPVGATSLQAASFKVQLFSCSELPRCVPTRYSLNNYSLKKETCFVGKSLSVGRKVRDSNPRYGQAVQRISSPPRSITPATFLCGSDGCFLNCAANLGHSCGLRKH